MKLTEELKRIALAQVMHSKDQAEGPRQEFLQKCRQAYLYEACKLPGKIISNEDIPKGITPFVVPVLRNAIREAKPQLLQSFTTDQRLAMVFRSRGWSSDNKALDDLLTFNLNRIFLDEQDGYETIEKIITEALNTGSSFGKVFVEPIFQNEEATSENWISETEFLTYVAKGWKIDPPKSFDTESKGSVKGFEWKTISEDVPDLNTGKTSKVKSKVFRGKIPLIKDESRIRAEFIESKDLWFDTSNGDDFNKCRYVCHRILTTVGEAEKMGFDPELLKTAAQADKDVIMQELAMNGVNDHIHEFSSTDPKEMKVFLYNHFGYSSQYEKGKGVNLYEHWTTLNDVLSIDRAPFIPFVHCKKKNIIGSFYGAGFFDEAKPYQDALTKQHRIIDQISSLSAWPRYIGVKGAYDRQSLMNNRPGSVIDAQSIDSVTYFPPIPLDQSILENFQLLKESEKESLRRGFGSANLEEIPPLATNTIAMGIFADSQRGMELSKCINRTLLTPLYKLIYETMSNEGWPLVDYNGEELSGIEYPSLYDITVDVNTPGDDAAQVAHMQNAIQTAAMLSQIQESYLSAANKYEMLKIILERADLDVSKMLTDPATIPDDVHAQQMQRILEAINFEAAKMQLGSIEIDQWQKAAEAVKTEEEVKELILKGASDRETAHQEALTRIQAVMSEASAKQRKNEIYNKQTNADIIFHAHEKRHDNQANGII